MAQGVKDWITVNGQHIPIFEGQTKQQAVENAIKHQQNTKKDADEKERQINANKQEAGVKNDKVESRTKSALNYALRKGEGLSFQELVADAKEEFNLNDRELEEFKNKLKMASLQKGIFGKHHEEWKQEWKKQGFDYDKAVQARDLTKMTEAKRKPEDLIPKNSYTNNLEYKQAHEWLQKHFPELQEVKQQWLAAYHELEQAQDKHLDPQLVKELGRAEARMFIWDEDYPDTAEARKKADQLDSKRTTLEEDVKRYQAIISRYETQNSNREREEYGRPDFKEAKGDYPGFKLNESTTSNVDRALKEGKAKVVEMTPEQYIRECSHYVFDNSTVEKTLRGRIGDKDTEKYARMMREGVKFDTPYINYTNEGQEGLHRAVAAYMNGIEKIPVIVIGKRR